MTRVRSEPPEWFQERNYGFLKTDDAETWLGYLQRCEHLLDQVRRRSSGEPLFEEEWGDVLGDELEKGMVPGGILGPPAVEVIDPNEVRALHQLEQLSLLCRINLRAPDAIIMQEFAFALADARVAEGANDPVKKPGKKSSLPNRTP